MNDPRAPCALSAIALLLAGCGAMTAQNPIRRLQPVNAVAEAPTHASCSRAPTWWPISPRAPSSARAAPQFSSRYEGVTFRFASAEHKALFDQAAGEIPARFGGYCANGIAYGIPWGGDADTWKMIDGKLYIFGGQASKDGFELDEKEPGAGRVLLEGRSRRQQQLPPAGKRLIFRVPHYQSGVDLAKPSPRPRPARRRGEVKSPRLIQIAHDDPAAIRAELLAGLRRRQHDRAQVPLRRARLAPVLPPSPSCPSTTRRAPRRPSSPNTWRHGAALGPARPWSTWAPATARRPPACSATFRCSATWRWTSR
jgi:YHS domain-containing protein